MAKMAVAILATLLVASALACDTHPSCPEFNVVPRAMVLRTGQTGQFEAEARWGELPGWVYVSYAWAPGAKANYNGNIVTFVSWEPGIYTLQVATSCGESAIATVTVTE